MVTPEDAVGIALDVARDGLAAKEMPIGAVIMIGDEVIAREHTKERELGRRADDPSRRRNLRGFPWTQDHPGSDRRR